MPASLNKLYILNKIALSNNDPSSSYSKITLSIWSIKIGLLIISIISLSTWFSSSTTKFKTSSDESILQPA